LFSGCRHIVAAARLGVSVMKNKLDATKWGAGAVAATSSWAPSLRSRLWLALAGCAVLVAALGSPTLRADQWKSRLEGGGRVVVDPMTNRIMVERNGVKTQLWDGVHRLKDGSSITVHSGQVVPSESILRAREQRGMPEEGETTGAEMWIGAPIVGSSPCEKLVERVCGEGGACGSSDACAPARQLLQMEQQERAAQATPNRMTYASGQCQEADRDREFFATCGGPSGQFSRREQPVRPSAPSPCRTLVEKVCGKGDRCGSETACDASRQLLDMAQQERAPGSPDATAALTPSEHQCQEALSDEVFFKPCGR
jgi:hypothetical protein